MSIPNKCPSCSGNVLVTELCCSGCKTTIKGSFELPAFALLSGEDEKFLKIFLSARGSIKEVERQLNISYPTVKARLGALLDKLKLGGSRSEVKTSHMDIVGRLERGEIAAREAIALLAEMESALQRGGGERPGRVLCVRVFEGGVVEPVVSMSVPLDWAKFMVPFIESKIGAKLAEKGHVLDLSKIQEAIEGQKPMKMVDVRDGGDKVEIFIE